MGRITRSHTFITGEVPSAADFNVDIDTLFTLVNGNLDADNVDEANTDGVVTMDSTQTITGAKSFTGVTTVAGTWQVPLILGTLRLWFDTTTDCLRVKRSAPSSITDGTILMEG